MYFGGGSGVGVVCDVCEIQYTFFLTWRNQLFIGSGILFMFLCNHSD